MYWRTHSDCRTSTIDYLEPMQAGTLVRPPSTMRVPKAAATSYSTSGVPPPFPVAHLEQAEAQRNANDGSQQRGEDLGPRQHPTDLTDSCTVRSHECRGSPRVKNRRPCGEDRV